MSPRRRSHSIAVPKYLERDPLEGPGQAGHAEVREGERGQAMRREHQAGKPKMPGDEPPTTITPGQGGGVFGR